MVLILKENLQSIFFRGFSINRDQSPLFDFFSNQRAPRRQNEKSTVTSLASIFADCVIGHQHHNAGRHVLNEQHAVLTGRENKAKTFKVGLGRRRLPMHIANDPAILFRHVSAEKAAFYRAGEVLRHLPGKGMTRAQLAADVLGDAHALDNGRGAAALVLAVWRQSAPDAAASIAGEDEETVPKSGDNVPGPVADGERIRDTWARAGVLVNELARPALFLNLPTNRTESHRWPAGEPAFASLRSLLRSPPRWDVAGRDVYVYENPNLLAIAADRWGADCAPLVCTDGMPAAAQRCLLAQLALGGARLRYHGDFDWPGLRIGNQVMREHRAEPWRFGTVDYIAAVRTAPSLAHPLEGKVAEASWDGALTLAMREHRVAIAEEALAASLLQDLDDR
ncbi:MAG: TIGR02679 family protein [Mesorhizobium sp.]|nr:MAG: TIGR02679 family protein [Mesorhizobium sp.]